MVKHSDGPSLDAVFGALSDPTRRRILDLLARTECCVTDLAKPFSISLPAISKHLRVLENAGLIKRERNGRVHRLQLRAKPMSEAADWIDRYREFWEVQLDALSLIWKTKYKTRRTNNDYSSGTKVGSIHEPRHCSATRAGIRSVDNTGRH